MHHLENKNQLYNKISMHVRSGSSNSTIIIIFCHFYTENIRIAVEYWEIIKSEVDTSFSAIIIIKGHNAVNREN